MWPSVSETAPERGAVEGHSSPPHSVTVDVKHGELIKRELKLIPSNPLEQFELKGA